MADDMADDRIVLQGMILFGRHGTQAAERELGQQFIVDVELRLDLRAAGVSDDLTRSVDYSDVYRRTRAIVEGPPLSLTEAVAERIARDVLLGHPSLAAVRVAVRKPHVRLDDTVLAGSLVEIVRRHDDLDDLDDPDRTPTTLDQTR